MIVMFADGDWRLWFVQLSGWPVFLASVGLAILFAFALTVVLTRLAHRSIAQNIVTAGVILTIGSLALLLVLAAVTRL